MDNDNNDNNDQRADLAATSNANANANEAPQLPHRCEEVLKAEDSPRFYWELAGDEYVEAHGCALEDEGSLANDLNTGAKILAVTEHYEACPSEVRLPSPEDETTLYTDAIAAILQVAVWNGHNLDDIVHIAIARQQQTYDWSATAAHSRPRRSHE